MAEHDPYAGQDASNPPERPAHPDPSRGVEDTDAFERMHGVVGHTAAKHGLVHPDDGALGQRAVAQAHLDALDREEEGLKRASESTDESVAARAKADLKGMKDARKVHEDRVKGDDVDSDVRSAGMRLAEEVQAGEARMTPTVDRQILGENAVVPAATEPLREDIADGEGVDSDA